MRNILLDINVIVDILSKRMPYVLESVKAFQQIKNCGDKAWIYVGSIHTLEYTVASELKRSWFESGEVLSFNKALEKAREKLQIFTSDLHWLTAFSEDGLVYDKDEPEDAQLVQAVCRLGRDALLLTRDKKTYRRIPTSHFPERIS